MKDLTTEDKLRAELWMYKTSYEILRDCINLPMIVEKNQRIRELEAEVKRLKALLKLKVI